MKWVWVIYEGAADVPSPALNGRTPMQVARAEAATRLAVTGQGGWMMPARVEAENVSAVRLGALLGLPMSEARRLARGPLEALGAGLAPSDEERVYRGDFVTMDGSILREAGVPNVRLEETLTLAAALQERWDESEVIITAVAPGRLIVRHRAASGEHPVSAAPTQAVGGDVRDLLAPRRAHAFVRSFMEQAREVLENHPVNEVRLDLGENPANAVWLWGGGRPTPLTHAPCEGRKGAVLTHSLLARGWARWADWPVLELEDLWEDGDRGLFKIARLVEALQEVDVLLVYVEAPHKYGRYGNPIEKARALDVLDHHLLEPLCSVLDAHEPYRIALVVDGAVSAATGRPMTQPLPFVVAGEGIEPDGVGHWDETACETGWMGNRKFDEMWSLMRD